MTQKEKIREWRLIDEEWNGIMEAKFNSPKPQTDPKSRAKESIHYDLSPTPLAALPIKKETNNISSRHKTATATTKIETNSVSNNEQTKEVELSPFKTIKISSEKKSQSSQDQGSTPANVAPRPNKRGRPRTVEKKIVVAEKKIKLEKEPIHAASSPVNKILTKNTASIRSSPRLQNRNGNFSSQETVLDEKHSISIKDMEKETTESLISVDKQTMGRIEHVESVPKVKFEATESSVSHAKQLLDEMKAFEELLLKAKETDATTSNSTLSETSEALYDENDFDLV